MSISPMQRTLAVLRENGGKPWIVEKSIPSKPWPTKIDLYNIIDVVNMTKDFKFQGVQICGTDFAQHDDKILASSDSLWWLRCGNTLELWGWRQLLKKRGGKAKIWVPRIKIYTVSDFDSDKIKNKSVVIK